MILSTSIGKKSGNKRVLHFPLRIGIFIGFYVAVLYSIMLLLIFESFQLLHVFLFIVNPFIM